VRRRRDLPPVDVAPEPPNASLALLRLRALGWTADPPPPKHLQDAYDRLRGELERLRAVGWSPGARLVALVECAEREGIGDQVRGIVERVTSPTAGVFADRPMTGNEPPHGGQAR
jgi:hypothetical protein